MTLIIIGELLQLVCEASPIRKASDIESLDFREAHVLIVLERVVDVEGVGVVDALKVKRGGRPTDEMLSSSVVVVHQGVLELSRHGDMSEVMVAVFDRMNRNTQGADRILVIGVSEKLLGQLLGGAPNSVLHGNLLGSSDRRVAWSNDGVLVRSHTCKKFRALVGEVASLDHLGQKLNLGAGVIALVDLRKGTSRRLLVSKQLGGTIAFIGDGPFELAEVRGGFDDVHLRTGNAEKDRKGDSIFSNFIAHEGVDLGNENPEAFFCWTSGKIFR
ncbi:hypothetical protein VFPFJ_00532 [Purpureocillium lilacinum]|uniref:Uncharacterized protein n=1 Tax=Purpureocillium lilacinum TaxID=33203 RepID=A0A179HYM8_PURLI|nr:hypothetical protein VFPFJ_00532 [Purpureocillium lilacinum]OAQ94423.1 hypothetical protein VFPFJ_00532 [Purpureocillium lilacinum]